MTLLALDPGPELTAWVELVDDRPTRFAHEANAVVLARLAAWPSSVPLVIEMIASYGMPVGAEVFETCVWIGRFMQSAGPRSTTRLKRVEIKDHLCHSVRANDAAIRQALIDRYGPGKALAIGNKASPGPLYGVHGDVWAALAVAVTAHDRVEAAV
jgi:hypothetical protein